MVGEPLTTVILNDATTPSAFLTIMDICMYVYKVSKMYIEIKKERKEK